MHIHQNCSSPNAAAQNIKKKITQNEKEESKQAKSLANLALAAALYLLLIKFNTLAKTCPVALLTQF